MIHPKAGLFALLLFGAAAFAASTEALLQQLETTEDSKVALKLVRELEPSVATLSTLDQGRFYVRLGMVQEDELHDINSADASYNHAIELLEPLHKPVQALADAYYERAYVKYLCTYDLSVYCPDREKAVALTRQLNHPELLVKYLAALSICYTDSSERFQQGLAVLNEAMTIAEKQGLSPDHRSMIYNATALLYKKNQLYDKAYEYSQLAYDQWASIDDRRSMDDMQHTLLVTAIEMGDLDKAEAHSKQLFKLADTSPDFKDFRFFADYDAGTIAQVKNELPRAIRLFQQAKNEEKNTEETVFIAMNRAQLATAYFINGNTEAALQEAAAVVKLPGYKSMYPDKQQAIQALLQFQKHNSVQAMRTLFDLARSEQEQRRQFLKVASRDYASRHESRMQQFEKQLLENKLQIQQLELSAQRRQQETSHWYLLLVSATALSLALLAYTLLRSRRRFRLQAQTDALTGIANRRHFFDVTNKLVKRAKQHELLVSVLVLDIDYFKRINDTYGHQVGDAAIRHVAVSALACLRTHDVIGRTGGEEFAAVLPDANVDQAWKIAEHIRVCIESTPLNHNGDQIFITVSIGLATGKLSAANPESLLQMADAAMYRAKGAGRNRSHLAALAANSSVSNENTIVAESA